MSSLLDLPEEILIIIIKQLDIKSIYNLYNSCGTLKDVIVMQGVIRICNLSCNTLATSKSLQLDLIKDISGHLYELNLSGVSNLRKSGLLPALKKMKCLKTLDVSFTDINICDMCDLYRNSPTIKNITINLCYNLKLVDKSLHDCQEVFKNFDNVHFVMKKRYSNLPRDILRKSSLDTLKFTLCDAGGRFLQDDGLMCQFKHLCVFMVNSDHLHASQGTWNALVPLMKMEDIEYIIFEYNATYSICASAIFINFLSENFKITSFFNFDKNKHLYGTVAILIWDKKSVIFDEQFFFNLKGRVRKLLAFEMSVASERTLPSGVDILNYDWFHIHQMEPRKNTRTDTEPHFKRTRVVGSDQVLDYDEIFSGHKNIKLSIHFPDSLNATLSSRSNYLSKITYLSLTGSFVRYSSEFFNILFRSCSKLITLNVEASSLSTCYSSLMRSMPLTQSLKNIRLIDKRIDFQTLFSSFTQCRTLENICVVDSSSESNDLADLTALYHCKNLYSLQIHAVMTHSTMSRFTNMIKTLHKNHPEHYINIVVEYYNHITFSEYNPFLNVFNVDPIKPI